MLNLLSNIIYPFLIIAGLLAVYWFINRTSDDRSESPTYRGVVRHVVDGDSLYLRGVRSQIRLWGVDAPERDEKGYKAATRQLVKLAKGRRVVCEQVDIDIYGRIVARCYLADQTEINRSMIESGTAQEYLRFTKGYYKRKDENR